jgi:hypothetical protein
MSNSEYKFMEEFYKSAYIKPDKIIFQNIETVQDQLFILVLEKEGRICIITKGTGIVSEPIPQEDIQQIILGHIEIQKLKEAIKNEIR